MKIRQGFVSNSSSSSFIVYGTTFEDRDDVFSSLTDEGLTLRDNAIRSYEDLSDDQELTEERKTEILKDDPDEIFYLLIEEFESMGFEINASDYSVSIGSGFTSMPMDVTRKEWQNTTQTTLKKYLKIEDFYVIDEVMEC